MAESDTLGYRKIASRYAERAVYLNYGKRDFILGLRKLADALELAWFAAPISQSGLNGGEAAPESTKCK